MAVQIIHKNSSVAGKPVSSSQIAYGELAINYNENGPFLQVRASDDEIWSVGGVTIGTDAPGSPLEGAFGTTKAQASYSSSLTAAGELSVLAAVAAVGQAPSTS